MSTKDSPQYRIRTVAKRTGVPAATLRAWERRYGIPRPMRTEAAYRTYSERDVQLVERLRQLCDSGLSPSDAASLLKEEPPRSVPPPPGVESSAVDSEAARDVFAAATTRLTDAARTMNLESLERELTQVRALSSGAQIFEHVLRPALARIGQLWHDGEISIGHEHIASEMINATARDLLRLAQAPQSSQLALLACFADELHATPLYGIGFRLLNWGCRVAILGQLTPPAGLAPAVRKLEPALVGLSVTITPTAARARELVEGYAMACGNTPWVVGGRGVPPIADVIRECGGHVAAEDEAANHELFRRLLVK